MNFEARQVNGQNLEPSRLLLNCRKSKNNRGDLPEPTWVRQSAGKFSVLWQPTNTIPPEVTVLIVENCNQPDWCFTLKFWQRYREISPLEKGNVFNFISEISRGEEGIMQKISHELGIPSGKEWISCYRILPELPATIKNKIHNYEISLKLIKYLLEIPEGLRSELFKRLEEQEIHLTVQQGRKLAVALRRVSDLSEKKWLQFLKMTSKVQQAKQAGQLLLNSVKKLAYPENHRLKEQFNRQLNAIKSDNKLRVNPPANFEGDYLDISFRWQRNESTEQIMEMIKQCQKLLKHV